MPWFDSDGAKGTSGVYDCPCCGGRFQSSRWSCDVAHAAGTCCHAHERELSPPTRADHPRRREEEPWVTTGAGLFVQPWTVSLNVYAEGAPLTEQGLREGIRRILAGARGEEE
jgi:hypothetical protein